MGHSVAFPDIQAVSAAVSDECWSWGTVIGIPVDPALFFRVGSCVGRFAPVGPSRTPVLKCRISITRRANASTIARVLVAAMWVCSSYNGMLSRSLSSLLCYKSFS